MDSELCRVATFSSWSCPFDCVSPITLARRGFYYSGRGDWVICCVCGEHCTASQYASQHLCCEFFCCPSVPETANDSISLGQGSLSLAVGDVISSGSSIVGGTSADMGIQAAEDIPPRILAVPSGCRPLAGSGIGGDALNSMGTLAEELRRVATFRSWLDHGAVNVGPIQLAQNGFSYSGDGDMILCCACGMRCAISGNPLQQHGLQSPGCPFSLKAATENFPPGQLAFPIGMRGSIVSVASVDMGIQAAADIPSRRLALSSGGETSVGNDIGGFDLDSMGPSAEGLAQLAACSCWSLEQLAFPIGIGPLTEAESDSVGVLRSVDLTCLTPASRNVAFPGNIYRRRQQEQERETTGMQVEDGQLVSCEEPQGTPVDAIMDREEIQIVRRFLEDSGFNRSHLKTLVAERLCRGKECLIPAVLLDAVFKKYAV